MKKKMFIIIGILFLTISGVIMKETFYPNLMYSQEYIAGKGNIKGDVNIEYFRSKSEDFDIGANKYGYAVFKNPDKALERLKKDYSKGINIIKKEHNLENLSHAK